MEFINLPHDKKIDRYSFNFKSIIGKGSFSKVYLGRDSLDDKLVAIKIIDVSLLLQAHLSALLQNEISIMKKLDHPNLLKMFEVLTTQNNIYIITEYCNQGDLSHILAKKGRLTEEETCEILKDILRGFQEILKYGVIHRDLKPANFFVHNGIFKIGDFGFAKRVRSLEEPIVTQMVGTPLYMAPQGMQGQPYTSKSDVYSLGIILYECLTGRTPWPATSQYDLLRNMQAPINFPNGIIISPEMKNLILAATVLDERSRLSWSGVYSHPVVERLNTNERKPSISLSKDSKGFGVQYMKTEVGLNFQEKDERIHFQVHKPSNTMNTLNTQPFEELEEPRNSNLVPNENYTKICTLTHETFECLKIIQNGNTGIQKHLQTKLAFCLLKFQLACIEEGDQYAFERQKLEKDLRIARDKVENDCGSESSILEGSLYSLEPTSIPCLLSPLLTLLSRLIRNLNHHIRFQIKSWGCLTISEKSWLNLFGKAFLLFKGLTKVKNGGIIEDYECSNLNFCNREAFLETRERIYEMNL